MRSSQVQLKMINCSFEVSFFQYAVSERYHTIGICIHSREICRGTASAPGSDSSDLPIVPILCHQRTARIALEYFQVLKKIFVGHIISITWHVSICPIRKPAHIICAVTDPPYDVAPLHVERGMISTLAWYSRWNYQLAFWKSNGSPFADGLENCHQMREFPSLI